MTNHGFEDYAQDFSFDSSSSGFSGGSVDPSELYIPETMDCQMCGYCVRGCPTYKVKPEGNYSPRGRVRLIEKVIRKNEILSDDEFLALNSCTLCRACETVCPSKMDYWGLYRQAMEAIAHRPKKSLTINLLLSHFAGERSFHRALKALVLIYQRSGLQRLLRWLPVSPLRGAMKQLDALLPIPYEPEKVPDQTPASPSVQTPVRHGEVALFTGCVADILDTKTHNATIQVLSCLGYDVRILNSQTCCGAMHAHDGDMEHAKALARSNLNVFSKSGVGAVIYNSSGCGAFLSEYDGLLDDEVNDSVPGYSPPIVDIMDFLIENDRIGQLSFRALKKKVAVHEPCSQRNVLKTQEGIYQALAQVPELDVMLLPDNAMCCGAGGTKMLTQPELASPLRDEKVQALLDSGADILLSTNLTCALHLARGIRETGRKISVMHPVTLLSQLVI